MGNESMEALKKELELEDGLPDVCLFLKATPVIFDWMLTQRQVLRA